MGFKEKMSKYYTESYIKKYGDRMAQFQGTVVSVKVEEKTILWIFHKIAATLIIRPERSKAIIKCVYNKNKWFKKPSFIQINQGNNVLIQGLKGKKGKDNREIIQIMNVLNFTTKKDLVPVDHSQIKKAKQQATKMR
ncbi:hypothetical protein [Clostridium fallax]|uniref:Uncharacterized protein n=1 Tax=Clostridium fallax TaxID=1533 RepID=A0A1M4UI29_9CLOT|nr:hypothetical protein [Clostridium fallax]SHE56432.1 hypothetical protein SAMN05443638_10533 [Clostridium fallax]SQB07578.1 Uncharacterised protein [Clostridium fallax]